MMAELEDELKRVGREESVAPSTHKAYVSADRRRLAAACGLEEEADMSLCLYVLDAMIKKRSKSTVATAMAAYGFARGEDPRESRFGPLLGAALKSAVRTVPSSSHDKANRESIDKLLKWGIRDGASKADLRIAVFALTSFGALLRVSEGDAIKREDVAVRMGEDDQLLIGVTVRRAKNDQEGKGRTTFLSLNAGSTGRIAREKYVHLLKADNRFFFPSLTDSSKGNADLVRKGLKRACQEIGIDCLKPHFPARRRHYYFH